MTPEWYEPAEGSGRKYFVRGLKKITMVTAMQDLHDVRGELVWGQYAIELIVKEGLVDTQGVMPTDCEGRTGLPNIEAVPVGDLLAVLHKIEELSHTGGQVEKNSSSPLKSDATASNSTASDASSNTTVTESDSGQNLEAPPATP